MFTSSPKKTFCFFFILSFVFFSIAAISTDIFKIDVRFAVMLQDMALYPLRIFPTLNGYAYADYFIPYFLLSYLTTFGGHWVNMWSIALPTILLSSFIVAMTYLCAEMIRPKTGIYASVLLLTAFQFVFSACGFGIDIAIAALGILMLYHLLKSPFRPLTVFYFALFLFLSIFIRGVLGLITFGAAVAGYILCKKNWKYIFIYGITGFLTALAAAVLLYVLMYLQGGKSLLQLFLDWQVSKRVAGGDYFYYIWSGVCNFAPLSFFFIAALFLKRKEIIKEPLLPLLGFIFLPMLVLSIPGGKHLRYWLIAVPVIACVAAQCIASHEKYIQKAEKLFSVLLYLIPCITILFLIVFMCAGQHFGAGYIPCFNFTASIFLLICFICANKSPEWNGHKFILFLLLIPMIYCGLAIPFTGVREFTSGFVKDVEKIRKGKLFFYSVGPDHDDLKYILHMDLNCRKDIVYLTSGNPNPSAHYTKMFSLKNYKDSFAKMTSEDIIITQKRDLKKLDEKLKECNKKIAAVIEGNLGHKKYTAVQIFDSKKEVNMIKLNKIFSDGVVLQRNKVIPVWGNASPSGIIECKLNNVTRITQCGADGSFILRFPPMRAGGPYKVTVTNKTTGEKVIVQDVLIGEVWLASGQSNMSFRMNESPEQLADFNKTASKYDKVRMFTVSMNVGASETERVAYGKWASASSPEMEYFSAVALWFAKGLHDRLHVPVGILNSSAGGTPIESWSSRNALLANPEYAPKVLKYDLTRNDPALHPAEEYPRTASSELGLQKKWNTPDFNDSKWEKFTIPNSWTSNPKHGLGTVWLRKEITIPKSWNGKKLKLYLGNIDKQDVTYFNGTEVGRTGEGFQDYYWDKKRCYEIPSELVRAGRAVIAIRAYSFVYAGGFYGTAADYYLEEPKTGKRISCAGAARFQMEEDHGKTLSTHNEIIWNRYAAPGYLFESMIQPLIPHAIQGVIWYQGENNATSIERAKEYKNLMTCLIRDWRYRWGENLPFILTELAGNSTLGDYRPQDAWPVWRNLLRLSAQEVKNCGIVSALDVGSPKTVHPKDKRSVGTRMASWALRYVYAEKSDGGEGPLFREMKKEGNRIRLYFDHTEKGLAVRGGKKLRGFYLVKKDDSFEAAKAEIEGDSIVIDCKDITAVKAVRYAWGNNPTGCNLVNSCNLPCGSFEAAL